MEKDYCNQGGTMEEQFVLLVSAYGNQVEHYVWDEKARDELRAENEADPDADDDALRELFLESISDSHSAYVVVDINQKNVDSLLDAAIALREILQERKRGAEAL
jgi:hypothetical protein